MVSINTYNFYKEFLFSQSGYILTEDKKYLLGTRLNNVLERHHIDSVEQLAQSLEKLPRRSLVQDVVDAMTINETFFFRDTKPFQILEDAAMLEFIKEKGQNHVNMWSAACSSGQEPYSIAISMERARQRYGSFSYKVRATDISTAILDKAKAGCYNDFEVKRGLNDADCQKYFQKVGHHWEIQAFLKRHIAFSQLNLVKDSYGVEKYDVIFLRNVLIYFDNETKARILQKMTHVMKDDGYLVLGASETVIGLGVDLVPAPGLHGYYQKKPH